MTRSILRSSLLVLVVLALAISAQPIQAAGWNYDLGMYLWALGMDGTMTVRGVETELDVPFSDIFDNLEMAFSTHLEANQRDGDWGWFFDLYYASLGNTFDEPKGEFDMNMAYVEGAGAYNVSDTFQLFAGLRYVTMKLDLEFDNPIPLPPLPDQIKVEGDQDWTDLMLGGRLGTDVGKRWAFWGRADLAGFGLTDGTDLTWNLVLMGKVSIAKRWALAFGYRWLDIDYENKDDDFAMNVRQAGPVLAVNYSFH